MLMRRDGEDAVYLNGLRHRPEKPLEFRRRMTGLGLPPDSALETARAFRGIDYRGVPVIAILRHVPDSPWFVTVKIDAAEADEPERRLGWEMAVITGLIALVNIAGAAVIWRGRDARIQEEKMAWFYAAANDTPAYLWMADPKLENSFINAPLAKFLGSRRRNCGRPGFVRSIRTMPTGPARIFASICSRKPVYALNTARAATTANIAWW
jgi:hypothetical protein